jgi:2-C-methyl-D-erythritol 4-phosphate cytidylyltransferase
MSTNGTGPAYAIIVAAGKSERMDGIDKVFATLMGRPLLVWTLTAFKKCDDIDAIVIVAAPDSVERMKAFVAEWRFPRVAAIVPGGETRHQSVRAGLDAAFEASIVAVHDGARPLVTAEMISRGVALARESGAAVCGIPSRDTVKLVEGDPPLVRATPDRASVWIAQTPQVFARSVLLDAHERATSAQTDDAALVEAIGHRVRAYEGAAWNLKITTPDDLIIAEALLRERFAS